jgi:hypothetical protein
MILEYLAPGARRRTRATDTTEAGLRSLLEVESHGSKVQKERCEVNEGNTSASCLALRGADLFRSLPLSLRGLRIESEGPRITIHESPVTDFLEARGGIEPPIKVLQTFALPLGDRASEHCTF